jgi:predicted dehydrogenase
MPPGDWIAGGFARNLRADDPHYRDAVAWDGPPAGFTPTQAVDHERFVNYYIHQVNLLRHLLGEPYRLAWADPSGVVLHAHSASGVPAIIEMAPYETSRAWQESAMVCYERGWIRLSLPAPLTLDRAGEVEVYEDRGSGHEPITVRPTLPWCGAMQQQAANFLAFVRGEDTPLCGGAEAREDLLVADAYIRHLVGGA